MDEQMREVVARAIEGQFNVVRAVYHDSISGQNHARAMQYAEVAIAAAEPHIRCKVIEELITDAITYQEEGEDPDNEHPYTLGISDLIEAWLRSHLEDN